MSNFELNIPYPKIEVSEKNMNYANLLLNNYAGPYGELTSIAQYFYQFLIVKHRYAEFGRSLESIFNVEMHHMKMLGELIVLFGGDPELKTVNNFNTAYWCGDNILDTKNIRTFLKENVEAEKRTIEAYKLRIRQINDDKIKRIIERIILDEQNHISIFEHYLGEFV